MNTRIKTRFLALADHIATAEKEIKAVYATQRTAQRKVDRARKELALYMKKHKLRSVILGRHIITLYNGGWLSFDQAPKVL